MHTDSDLKQIFHEGWNHPGRVENCVCNTADKEFAAGGRHEAWLHVLAAAMATEERRRVLDVGTGPGIFACLYAKLGHECVGLDFSEGMVAAARERAARLSLDCTFVHGDAERPPFPDACFDVISTRHVLYTLPHPGVAVRQWMRVLRPGGRLIIIGDDLRDRKPRRFAKAIAALTRRLGVGRAANPAKRWSASPEYLAALDQCPLSKHHTHLGVLQAVMEAAGVEEIRSVPADEVYAARIALGASRQDGVGRPFVLTGTKP